MASTRRAAALTVAATTGEPSSGMWNRQGPAPAPAPRRRRQRPTAAAWSPDGTTGGHGRRGRAGGLWRVPDREQLGTLPGRSAMGAVRGVLPGRLLDRRGRVGRQAGHALGRCHPRSWWAGCPIPPSWPGGVRPGGKTLATAATDGTVRLWDVASRARSALAFPGPESVSGANAWRSIPAATTSSSSTTTAPAWCGTWTPTTGRSGPARWPAAP